MGNCAHIYLVAQFLQLIGLGRKLMKFSKANCLNRLSPNTTDLVVVSSPLTPLVANLAGWRLPGLGIEPSRTRIGPYRTRIVSYRAVSQRIEPGSSRLAPYRLVSHRIAPYRTESDRLAPSPNRLASESNRLAMSRTQVLLLAPVWEFSCQITPVCFLHSLQAKVPCSLSNLTPVCVGVLLGLGSTPGPPWCSLWPSIVGGNHVAFAVLPAERNLSTTHLFGKSQNQWSLFLHTSFLQGVYSRELWVILLERSSSLKI